MWYGCHLPDDPEAIVPASALYSAESTLIAMTGSWRTTLSQVQDYVVSRSFLHGRRRAHK